MDSVGKAGSQDRRGRGVPFPAQILSGAGDYWTIVYGDRTLRLRDAVGLHYLAYLLARPNRRFPVGELLAAVTGKAASDSERARPAVSKRLRAVIARIKDYHPTLGYHLSTSIKTGYACAYLADPSRPAVWTVGRDEPASLVGRNANGPVPSSAARVKPATQPLPQASHAHRQRPLSRREREVVTVLLAGASVKEAATRLGLSYRTVETHLERLKEREQQPRLHALLAHLVKQGRI
jgi:DNA-binding CsgD family transcriptional regulator